MADGWGQGFVARFKESDYQDRLHNVTIVGNVSYANDVLTIGSTTFTITADQINKRIVVTSGTSTITLPDALSVMQYLQGLNGGNFNTNQVATSTLNDSFRMEIRNESAGPMTLVAGTNTTIVNADQPVTTPNTFTTPAGVTTLLDVYPTALGTNPQVVYEPILYSSTSTQFPIVTKRDRIWIPASDEVDTNFSLGGTFWTPGVDADGVPYLDVSNNNAAQLQVDVYWNIPVQYGLSTNKPMNLTAFQIHNAPYGLDLQSNPTVTLSEIQYLQTGQTTNTILIPGSVSGQLPSVGATVPAAPALKFRYLSFSPTTNPLWLDGVQRTEWLIHATFILQGVTGGVVGSLRLYGINVDFNYDYS